MAIFAMYFSIYTMNVKFCPLILANLATSINSILLIIKMSAASGCASSLDVPTTGRVMYNMV